VLVHARDPQLSEARAARSARASQRPAGTVSHPTVARILELQRTAGNRAVSGALAARRELAVQRLDWEDAVDFLQWTNPFTLGGKAIRELTGVELNLWAAAEQAIRLSASKTSIPASFVQKLRDYAAYNAADGAILKNALAQGPSHYIGGLLLGGNADAAAITFGNSVFYGEQPDVDTYIHEMVHINQYQVLGRKAFVLSYFGLSAATIAKRVLKGEPIRAMRSSPHEEQAYQLEARFKAWRQANP
jgi:hypothetical protein